MERVLRSTPSTLTFTFYGDGAPADPVSNLATVNIFKADGTQIVTNGSTSRQSTGVYTYALAGQTSLNRLTVKCSGTFGTDVVTVTTIVEIVGGFYFTIAELRAWDTALTSTSKYPDDKIVDTRNFVEEEFEDNCNRAFVPRFGREILRGDGTDTLYLTNPEPFTVTKLIVDGTDITSTAVLEIDQGFPKILYRRDDVWPAPSSTSTSSTSNITIEYEYGPANPPFRIVEAAKKRARSKLVAQASRIDERATYMQVDGFGSFTLATPGMRGSITGIPEVDKVLYDNDLYGGVTGIQ